MTSSDDAGLAPVIDLHGRRRHPAPVKDDWEDDGWEGYGEDALDTACVEYETEAAIKQATAEGNLALAHAETAYLAAISALGRRALSRRELERRLTERDFDPATVAATLERLEQEGIVDDLALAQNLVGLLQERKGLGRAAIAAELTRRLLAPAAIEYALDLVDASDELDNALRLAEARARQLRGVDREAAVRRLSAYLARRGYSGSTVRAAVTQALAAGSVRFS